MLSSLDIYSPILLKVENKGSSSEFFFMILYRSTSIIETEASSNKGPRRAVVWANDANSGCGGGGGSGDGRPEASWQLLVVGSRLGAANGSGSGSGSVRT